MRIEIIKCDRGGLAHDYLTGLGGSASTILSRCTGCATGFTGIRCYGDGVWQSLRAIKYQLEGIVTADQGTEMEGGIPGSQEDG